jgi:hypothetical protein
VATIAELIENVAKIRKFVGIYLDVPEPTDRQKNAMKVDLVQLDRNLGALQAALTAPVALVTDVPLPPVVKALAEEVPNFGDSPAMSSSLYNEWVSAWFVRTFPEAYRDWPPTVYAVTAQQIAEAATEDGCLAQVSASGSLGWPDGPYADLGDWSLYTALVTTDGFHRVYHMGKLVGEQDGGDGLEFAKSLGFDW